MATLTVFKSAMAGTSISSGWDSAAAGGDVFPNDGDTLLVVQSTTGTPITLTFAAPGVVDGLGVADKTYSISNAAMYIVGPFPPHLFNDSSGQVAITYSSVSGVRVRPVEIL